jgi:DNA-binding MarR family transcriptional regulator
MKHYTAANYIPTNSVGFSLTRARNVVAAEMDAALRDIDITHQQMGIVLALRHQLVDTPFELSKMLEIDTGLMTRMLDKLERQGLLTRMRSVDDRRVVKLQLTDKGLDTAGKIPARAPDVLNRRLRHFSKEEFTEFHRLLNKFLEA